MTTAWPHLIGLALICVDQNVWCKFTWGGQAGAASKCAGDLMKREFSHVRQPFFENHVPLFMVLAPSSKSTRSQLSIDAKHAGTRIDLLSSQPAKVGL